MIVWRFSAAATTLVAALSMGQPARAQSVKLVPFDEFYRDVSTRTYAAEAAQSGTQVSSSASFEPMRNHVVSLYRGVRVQHSFLLDAHPFDCIPIEQQPSVRLQHLQSIATPPPAPIVAPPPSGAAPTLSQLGPAERADALGNATTCETGTIPMRRVTLDDIGRFKSLGDFFHKGPASAGQVARPSIAPATAGATHKYAHSYEFVANIGGTVDISLWNPPVDPTLTEIFSLSQFWYINDNGPVQTLEGGVQNYPQKYGPNESVLFIYWTADGYNNTGCYNLDCPGFVQTNGNVYLGRGFTRYGTVGGAQYVIPLRVMLYQGNWWIFRGSGSSSNAIGYYPGSLYAGTPMSVGADEIDYGGEVVGVTVWPPMGNGRYAGGGFGVSAFDRNISYYQDASHLVPAALTAAQPSIRCYTDVTVNNSPGSGVGTYFTFGGPGGQGC